MKTLETNRLVLRLWQTTDIADLFEYAKDERVGKNAGWPPHESIETSEQIVKMFIQDADVYAIVLKSENKVIGSIGLHKRGKNETDDAHYEVGYVLNPEYWGNGFVPEAVRAVLDYGFIDLGLTEIWCGHFDFNENSKRVIEKTGFVYQYTTTKTLPLLGDIEVTMLQYKLAKMDYLGKC